MSVLRSVQNGFELVRKPPKYLIGSLIVSVGGLLNGLDTGVIGPVTTMPTFVDYFGHLSSALHGLVVSSVLLSATLASLFAGTLSDTMGRTRAVAIGALIFAVGAALEAGALNLAMLIVGRLVVGAGEGFYLSTLVVYICEISPPARRGPLASLVQVLITVGLMIGYFMCYGTVRLSSSFSWRFPLAIQSGIAVLLAFASYFHLPHSPRWLAHKGRNGEAMATWDTLGVSNAEREKGLLQSNIQLDPVAHTSSTMGIKERWQQSRTDLLKVFGRNFRKQMFLGVFMMSMQQLSGIDGVLYYAPLLFQQAGLTSSTASFLASGVSSILIFVTSIPAFLLTDRVGRRASTIYGGLILSVTMALIGSLYASEKVHQTYGPGRWVVIVAIYIFAITYCMTWALGVKVFTSEIQPIATRATATSLAQSANCISNFFVAFITPVLLAKSSYGIYFLFCGASIITVGVCAIFMPETQGHSLETITESFHQHLAMDATLIRLPRLIVRYIWTFIIRRKPSRPLRETRASSQDGVGLSIMTIAS